MHRRVSLNGHVAVQRTLELPAEQRQVDRRVQGQVVEGFVAAHRAEYRVALIGEEFLNPSELLGVLFEDQGDPVFSVHHDSPCRIVGKASLRDSCRLPRLRRNSAATAIGRGPIVECDQQNVREAPVYCADCLARTDRR